MPFLAKPKRLFGAFKSYISEWIPILKTVTVEPAALLMMTSLLMSYILYQDLMIERICTVNLNYDPEVCKAIVNVNASFAAEEIEIQKIAAEIRSYRSIIDHSVPLIFILFMGPWSDVYGRKLPMFISSFGVFLLTVIMMICSYFETIDGKFVGFITIIKAFGGAEVGFKMAAFSYITDTTDNSVRTIRTGLLSAGYTLGVPLGFALGGAVRNANLSYIVSFSIAAVLALASCLIILLTVDNTKKCDRKRSEREKNNPSESVAIEEEIKETRWWKVLDPRYSLKSVLTVTFGKRRGYERLHVCLLIIALIFVLAPIHGEFGVMYSYLRIKVHWNASEYGYFSTYNTCIGVVGVLVSMGLLSHWLKLSDPAVGFISGISQFGGCVIYALANTLPLMYLAPTVDMMNGTMAVVAQSMISKIVRPDEIGSISTVLAIIENLVPLVMDPTYSTLYRLTLDTFAGSFFLLSGALTVPPQAIYCWFVWRDGTIKAKPISSLENEEDAESKYYKKGVLNPAFSSISINKDTAIEKL